MKIKCLIVDDETLARTLLADYIKKLPHLELVKKCGGATEAMAVLQNKSVDLMFLDVQMPDLTGVDLLRSLKHKPVVIFTTAYPDYALEGYALDVIDYLLKPISFERFVQAVNKASDQIKLLKGNDQIEDDGYITIKAEHRIHKVLYREIMYIEGSNEYVTFHLKQGKKIISLDALKNLERLLPDYFLRIHRSYIINKKDVRSLYGNMVEINDKLIPIGKTYKNNVLDQLF